MHELGVVVLRIKYSAYAWAEGSSSSSTLQRAIVFWMVLSKLCQWWFATIRLRSASRRSWWSVCMIGAIFPGLFLARSALLLQCVLYGGYHRLDVPVSRRSFTIVCDTHTMVVTQQFLLRHNSVPISFSTPTRIMNQTHNSDLLCATHLRLYNFNKYKP